MRTLSGRLLLITRNGHQGIRTGAHAGPDAPDIERSGMPMLLTVAEAAELLRTSRRAIYVMVERRQLPAWFAFAVVCSFTRASC